MAKKRFSGAQKKAYWMGYGAGITGGDVTYAADPRQGRGQRKDLCDSMRAGYFDGRQNRRAVPFHLGHKRYPISSKVYYKEK